MFLLKFDEEIVEVTKIRAAEFTNIHREVLSRLEIKNGKLILPDKNWRTVFLGAGEEKAVYCVCDNNKKVFAIEVIDEKHYLNGRFIGGEYFFNMRISSINNIKLNPDSLIGLTFTGLIKVREYVHGYEWGNFQYDSNKKSWVDKLHTFMLQSSLSSQFRNFQDHYKDVHDRNVMFEIRNLYEKGILTLIRDYDHKVKLIRVGLQAIDVR